MTVTEQLTAARADLAALESDTATLQQNVSDNEAKLNDLRRAARSGTANFEAVVEQQSRVTAARGLLDMHLQDMATAYALVDELQAAQTFDDLISEGRSAQAEAIRLSEEYAQKAQEAEALIQTALSDLHALQRAYNVALTRSLNAATQHTGAALGIGHDDVLKAITRPDVGLRGPEGAALRGRVADALEDFAAQVGTTPSALHALMRRQVPELITYGHYPMLGRVNRA